MPQDLNKLAVWQAGCFNDRATLYRVSRPKNALTGEPLDEVPQKAYENVVCQFLFKDKLEDPTDVGRIRGVSDRRAIQFNTTADQEIGSMWYVRDTTPERPAGQRYVYRAQDEPTTYPSQGVFDMNLTTVTLDIVEHPPSSVLT